MRVRVLFAVLTLMVLAGLRQPALADDKLKNSSATWKAMDNCQAAAIRAFPDYTPDSLAKREAMRRRCMLQGNLPAGDSQRLPEK